MVLPLLVDEFDLRIGEEDLLSPNMLANGHGFFHGFNFGTLGHETKEAACPFIFLVHLTEKVANQHDCPSLPLQFPKLDSQHKESTENPNSPLNLQSVLPEDKESEQSGDYFRRVVFSLYLFNAVEVSIVSLSHVYEPRGEGDIDKHSLGLADRLRFGSVLLSQNLCPKFPLLRQYVFDPLFVYSAQKPTEHTAVSKQEIDQSPYTTVA